MKTQYKHCAMALLLLLGALCLSVQAVPLTKPLSVTAGDHTFLSSEERQDKTLSLYDMFTREQLINRFMSANAQERAWKTHGKLSPPPEENPAMQGLFEELSFLANNDTFVNKQTTAQPYFQFELLDEVSNTPGSKDACFFAIEGDFFRVILIANETTSGARVDIFNHGNLTYIPFNPVPFIPGAFVKCRYFIELNNTLPLHYLLLVSEDNQDSQTWLWLPFGGPFVMDSIVPDSNMALDTDIVQHVTPTLALVTFMCLARTEGDSHLYVWNNGEFEIFGDVLTQESHGCALVQISPFISDNPELESTDEKGSPFEPVFLAAWTDIIDPNPPPYPGEVLVFRFTFNSFGPNPWQTIGEISNPQDVTFLTPGVLRARDLLMPVASYSTEDGEVLRVPSPVFWFDQRTGLFDEEAYQEIDGIGLCCWNKWYSPFHLETLLAAVNCEDRLVPTQSASQSMSSSRSQSRSASQSWSNSQSASQSPSRSQSQSWSNSQSSTQSPSQSTSQSPSRSQSWSSSQSASRSPSQALSCNLRTCQDLQAIQNDLNGEHVCCNNIDCADPMTGVPNFIPIGTFRGTFDCQHYTISNLTIQTLNTVDVGLFGVTNNAILSNVNIVNATIKADYDANCPIVSGGLFCGGFVGSLVGTATNSHIFTIRVMDSFVTVIDPGRTNSRLMIGGLAGNVRATNAVSLTEKIFTDVVVEYPVIRQPFVDIGGVFGDMGGNTPAGPVTINATEIAAIGPIVPSSPSGTPGLQLSAGGIVGAAEGFSVNINIFLEDCYSNSNITNTFSSGFSGGIVGRLGATINRCYYGGAQIITSTFIGGIIGTTATPNLVSKTYWDTDNSNAVNCQGAGPAQPSCFARTKAQMQMQATYVDWDFASIWMIDEGNDFPRLQNIGPQTTTLGAFEPPLTPEVDDHHAVLVTRAKLPEPPSPQNQAAFPVPDMELPTFVFRWDPRINWLMPFQTIEEGMGPLCFQMTLATPAPTLVAYRCNSQDNFDNPDVPDEAFFLKQN